MPGRIVIINGASSSGKSSVIKALQGMLADPYLEMGLDRFIWALPKRYLDRPLWDDVLGLADAAGATGHQLVCGMHRAIRALSLAGWNVVADHVLVEAAWAADLDEVLAGLPLTVIGLQCPLAVLEEREQARRDRTLGQAAKQYPVIHRYARYDLMLDTSVLSPAECAVKIKGYLEI